MHLYVCQNNYLTDCMHVYLHIEMKKSCRFFEYARASAYNLFNQREATPKLSNDAII